MKLLSLITALTLTCTASFSQSADALALNAEKVNENVMLTWSAAIEPETNHFEIQRSEDGKNWAVIALMFPFEDNTQAHSYKYNDKSLKQSGAYYRIRQIVINKTENFSDSKQVVASAK